MASRDKAGYFDFFAPIDEREFQLMSTNISMGSLWSIDSDSCVPPYPDTPPPPISIPILADERSMAHPFGPGKAGPDKFKISTSLATPPRMQNLLLEPLCIDRWVAMIITRASPPGHIPWEATAIPKEVPWVASGSLYSPVQFRKYLKWFRSAPRGFATFGSIRSKATQEHATHEQDPKNRTLVFERELTLNADGESKRLSLRVPATTMDPEMVDIMLELQDLNSFFKDSLEDLDHSVAALEKERDKLTLPLLKIPDSHHALATPSEPSPCPERRALPLAARRGKNLPSPILLVEKTPLDPYPSIPTAFLGSPSTYSPKFEHARAENRLSLDLMGMVTKLRSQCDSLHKVSELPVESPESAIRPTVPSDQVNTGDKDGWAFAVSFFDDFGNNARLERNQKLQTREEIVDGGKTYIPESEMSYVHIPAHVPPSPCPSIPLPATPPLRGTVNLLSPPGTVRGILKSSKNVRFASLPEPRKSSEDSASDESPTSSSFTSSPPMASPHTPRRPPRLRAYSAVSRQDTEITPQTYGRRSSDAQVGLKPKNINDNFLSMPVTPPTPDDPFRQKNESGRDALRLPGARHGSPARDSTLIIRGRQSFGRFNRMDHTRLKENQTMSPSPRGKGSRWTMNDMTFRRGSNSNQSSPPEGALKSRMPVPLRNILTRFKEK